MAALGAGAIATGAAMKEIADTWGTSQDAAQSAYLASFHGLRSTTEVLFFAAFLAMGLYLATLAAAILAESVFPHWLGWASAVSAGLVITGNLLSIVSEPAWLAVLAGFALFLIVLLALGVCLWRREPSAPSAPAPTRATDRIVA
jgi:hypothetical protein